jgi:hypothetical protein
VDLDAEHRPLVGCAKPSIATAASSNSVVAREDSDIEKRSLAGRQFRAGTTHVERRCLRDLELEETAMGRGILLWLLGVPIPVIILLWLFFGH